MGLKQIKLNNFLFKKTKYLSPNPNPQPQSFEPNHNLRIHIKSEMSQQLQPQVEEVMNSASTSINMKTALSNKTSFYNKKNKDINIPNDLTFRILKLSKNKVRSGISQVFIIMETGLDFFNRVHEGRVFQSAIIIRSIIEVGFKSKFILTQTNILMCILKV